MIKSCGSCSEDFEAKRAAAKYCSDRCRKRALRARRTGVTKLPPAAPEKPVTAVADALRIELTDLGVAEVYEGVVALGIARQLDSGAAIGTAYATLSKELDRRVEELRRRVVKVGDLTVAARSKLNEKRLSLVG